MIHEKGEIHQVKCKICTFVERKEELLVPKLNNLLKYVVHKIWLMS
jgi:hypothetical protein